MNTKNAALSPIASDLGMGLPVGQEDLMNQQLRQKKLKEAKGMMPGMFGDQVASSGGASADIFGGMR